MSINVYVQQLKEDLRAATTAALNNQPRTNSVPVDNLNQHFEDVENIISGRAYPLSTIVGIEKVSFPPGDKLTDDHKAELAQGMKELLEAHHFFPDFPSCLPDQYKYELLRSRWDDKQVKMSRGEWHMEFCDYEPTNCPFPQKYCSCLEIELRMKKNDEAF